MLSSALTLAPLIILAPFVAFVIQMTAGAWPERLRNKAHVVGIAAIGFSLAASLAVAAQVWQAVKAMGHAAAGHAAPHAAEAGHAAAVPAVSSFVWAKAGDVDLTMGIHLDGLAAIMLLVVTVVSAMVQVYSIGYMHGDARYSRFFAYLSLFSSAMLGLVLANNLVELYVFWELMGLSSYLLIGFWFEKPSAMRAAKKAFIVTRLGDVGMFFGLLLLFQHTQSLEYGPIFEKVAAMAGLSTVAILTPIALLLFCGAVGKSAQFPLHVWLPDAMEGPTPVSALIHAATMVAAGVYLVGRMFPLFKAATVPWEPAIFGHTLFSLTPLMVVAWAGAITALLGATIGVLQTDIKRVLAFSTISQLGYMMVGLGMGGLFAGLFHLVTHAYFKALLFLGSGSVIHGCGGEQDIMKMGGLAKKMPKTYWTFLIGTLSLAGVPFVFSGFYSKEEILLSAYGQKPIFWMLVAGAFLTAFYMMRLVSLTFLGEPRDHKIHAHESPKTMWIPLAVLAALSFGWWRLPMGSLHGFIDLAHLSAPLPHAPEVMYIGIAAGLLGLGLGLAVYRFRLFDPRAALIKAPALGEKLLPGLAVPGAYTLVKNKYYFDELYWNVLVRPLLWITGKAFEFDQKVIDRAVNQVADETVALSVQQGWFDREVVDRAVETTGRATGGVGLGFRKLQTGLVQNYVLVAFVGMVAAAGLYLYLGF